MARREVSARVEAIDQLSHTLVLKQSLIRELHHRINNNLQMAISIMDLEAAESGPTQMARERIRDKLIAIRSVHDVVYDLESLDRLALSHVLRRYAVNNLENEEALVVDLGVELYFGVDEMVGFLLIIHELLPSKLPRGQSAVLRVSSEDGRGVLLSFPPGIAVRTDTELLGVLARSIKARLVLEQDDGRTAVRIDLPQGFGAPKEENRT